jgi:hypothetical protein
MRQQDIGSDVRLVRASEGASRRTKNHLNNSSGVVGGFVADKVLILGHDTKPLAWLPISEVEVA